MPFDESALGLPGIQNEPDQRTPSLFFLAALLLAICRKFRVCPSPSVCTGRDCLGLGCLQVGGRSFRQERRFHLPGASHLLPDDDRALGGCARLRLAAIFHGERALLSVSLPCDSHALLCALVRACCRSLLAAAGPFRSTPGPSRARVARIPGGSSSYLRVALRYAYHETTWQRH